MKGKFEEELEIRQEIVELYRKNHKENIGSLFYWCYFDEIPDALKAVADLLEELGGTEESKKVRYDILEEYKKIMPK